jgi:diketogulonate reductase-like aldo/keto reductase
VTQAYGPLTPILRHKGGPLIPVLDRIAQRKGIDVASVLLLWTIQKGVVAITSSGNPDNIRRIAAVDALEDLTEQDIRDIDEAGKQVHFRHYVGG